MDFLPYSKSSGALVVPRPKVAARYDAAVLTPSNRRHWKNADFFSVNASNLPLVRRDLRSRSRYEVANNSYARGIILTLTNDTIGSGPTLQMLTPDAQVNKVIETEFERWATEIGLAEKLRTMRMAKAQDGEAFAMMIDNKALSKVTLDIRLYEADQVAAFGAPVWSMTDGITLDENGNPISYTLLRQHPGDLGALWFESEQVPAYAMIHYYRIDRPAQVRGIPEITSALPLFAMLREYTLATLDAAKAAAYISGILKTDSPANGEAEDVEPMDTVELERNTLMTMPQGWDMTQVKAEQPTGTYAEFKKEIINEIARCLNMPFNIAAGNSAQYNYASGRMDHQIYFKSVRVEQSMIETKILDRVLQAWIAEASRIEGLLPQGARRLSFVPDHQWFWPGQEHVDPEKEANAQTSRLANLTTSLAHEYAKQGLDWETQLIQIAKEKQMKQQLGIDVVVAPVAQPQKQKVTQNEE